MSFQRAVSYLRPGSPSRQEPCVGCGALAPSENTWAVCAACVAQIRVSLSHLPRQQQQHELRRVLRSQKAVRAVLVELRMQEGVTA